MRSKLGSELMTSVYRTLLKFQGNIVSIYLSVPLTGNFFQMRGSVLNWCPIGRNAMIEDREKWRKIDEKWGIREMFIDQFKAHFNSEEITIKLGGETSFDIYPKGWNKTFPLDKEPFSEYEKIYFAGDRCFKSGNDEELYNYLLSRKNCDAFQVNNTEETIKIIKKVIEEQ
jgi:phosphomannomutase